ncbi:U-scoloptoxin(01)-Er1a-like [Amblyomma americanum]
MHRNLIVLALSATALYLVCGKSLHRAKRWEEFPDVEFHFDCSDKPIGFYADMEFDCKIFHMCDAYGRRVPHICANDTAFNQRYRVCDWEYNVNCQDSPNYFYLNDLTYETEPPTNAKA